MTISQTKQIAVRIRSRFVFMIAQGESNLEVGVFVLQSEHHHLSNRGSKESTDQPESQTL